MSHNDFGERAVALDALACPQCGASLASGDSQLVCTNGHSFNVARQGYASLLGGGKRASTGDDAAMIAARVDFLAAGHYRRIADAASAAIPESARGLCVDVAGGTGYYLSTVLDAHPQLDGLSLDLSPYAARRAAHAHPRAVAATADAWQRFPLQSASVRCLLNVFGPRNAAEMARVLEPDGVLVVVTPNASHLEELREPLGLIGIDSRKRERVDAQLAGFVRVSSSELEYAVTLASADAENVARMGPSAHHIDPARLEAGIRSLPDPATVTVSVTVSSYTVSSYPVSNYSASN